MSKRNPYKALLKNQKEITQEYKKLVERLNERCEVLTVVAKEFHWMARRYADGRRTYATGLFNEMVRDILRLGISLQGHDGIIWARDGQGRLYDHLSPREAEVGTAEARGVYQLGGQSL